VWNEYGTYIEHASDSHLLCQTQTYNTSTGICIDGANSTKKGEVCTTDADCPSNTTNVLASCNCGWTSAGTKYCDILKGDTEWESAHTAFKAYFDATKDSCNVASRWGECDQKSLYNDWM
jgi:hypothetical protein